MRLFTEKSSYDDTICLAESLTGEYESSVIFHCYWQDTAHRGALTEKHLYSILSCWYFNVRNNKHKIILWLENNQPNEYNDEIKKYAEIRYFDPAELTKGTILDGYIPTHPLFDKNQRHQVKLYSNFVRMVLLYKYGGCWFDLDCFFLRSWDPLFAAFSDELCFYQLTRRSANNAVVLSLQPQSPQVENFLRFSISQNKGWGFFDGRLKFANAKTVDALILPCSWFNPSVLSGQSFAYRKGFLHKTKTKHNFDNFYKGAFCHHWHNAWNIKIDETSPMLQLVKIIKDDIRDDSPESAVRV